MPASETELSLWVRFSFRVKKKNQASHLHLEDRQPRSIAI